MTDHVCDTAGIVLGNRCNVCNEPLDKPGCPLCAECCDREPS